MYAFFKIRNTLHWHLSYTARRADVNMLGELERKLERSGAPKSFGKPRSFEDFKEIRVKEIDRKLCIDLKKNRVTV